MEHFSDLRLGWSIVDMPHLAWNRDFALTQATEVYMWSISGGGGQLAQIYVGMCPGRTKSRPITRAKFFIQKPPKTYKNDTNLLIFLDLTYNPCKNFKSYSLQGQNFKIFLIFTHNQGKGFLILPITRGYTCIPGLHWEFNPPPSLQLLSCITSSISNRLCPNFLRSWRTRLVNLILKMFPTDLGP